MHVPNIKYDVNVCMVAVYIATVIHAWQNIVFTP